MKSHVPIVAHTHANQCQTLPKTGEVLQAQISPVERFQILFERAEHEHIDDVVDMHVVCCKDIHLLV